MLTQLVETQEASQSNKRTGNLDKATKDDQNSKLEDSCQSLIWNVADEARNSKSKSEQGSNSRQEASNGSIQLFTKIASL